MPTTSNFGWTTPADTDLVKDGALAIRTLGNGIDTSMAQLKGGTTGQVLSKTSNTDMAFTWVTQDDANAIQNAIVDAKGDLIAATANDTPARLAVGANDTMLIADSSQSTGLAWKSAATQFPWAAWTPTLTGITIGNGSVVARYVQIGKTVVFSLRLEFGSTSSFTGRVGFSLPSTPSKNFAPSATVDDYGSANGNPCFSIGLTSNYVYVDAIKTDGTYAVGVNLSASVPFTWSIYDSIQISGSYEAA